MRKMVILSVAALAVTLVLFLPSNPAAPALGDKPIKWEYGELTTKRTVVEAPPAPGGKGQGNDHVIKTTLVWITQTEEFEGDNWKNLADKLKAPPRKDPGSTIQEKLRLMNHLGADGWELIDHQVPWGDAFRGSSAESCSFKRRMP
jgi:hypothetical protein